MSWTKKVWRERMAEGLFELGNTQLQISEKMDNYDDLSEMLDHLDDCGVPEYLEHFLDEKYFSSLEFNHLLELSTLIKKAIESYRHVDYKGLMSSDLWGEIVLKSKYLYINFFYEDHLNDKLKDPHNWIKKYPLLD